MTEFFKTNNKLSLYLLLSILFFLRKGIQYAVIGSFIPLVVVICMIVLFAISVQKGKKVFILTGRIWAIILLIWAAVRILITLVNITIAPFDGSFHLNRQFNGYALILSIAMLVLGVLLFRGLHKKRVKDWV